MVNLKLRRATAEDREFAFQTKKAGFREYAERVWGWDKTEQRRLHDRRFPEQKFQVIEWSGIDVGVLATVRDTECIKINQLFIQPEYQGRGIGGECMRLVLEEADRLGLPVRLQVLKVNPRAQAFYRRLGFVCTGETDTHVQLERCD